MTKDDVKDLVENTKNIGKNALGLEVAEKTHEIANHANRRQEEINNQIYGSPEQIHKSGNEEIDITGRGPSKPKEPDVQSKRNKPKDRDGGQRDNKRQKETKKRKKEVKKGKKDQNKKENKGNEKDE